MSQTEFLVRPAPTLGPGSRRLRFACQHGFSSALLLPGDEPLSDLKVLDLLLARHHGAQHCQCVPDLPSVSAQPARA